MFAIIGVRCEISSNVRQIEFEARAPGQRHQVDDRVGRSADCHVGGDRIFKRMPVVRMSRGFKSSQTISTMRRPQSLAMRE